MPVVSPAHQPVVVTNSQKKPAPQKLTYHQSVNRHYDLLDQQIIELNQRLWKFSQAIMEPDYIKREGGCSSLDGIQNQLVVCYQKLKAEDSSNLQMFLKDFNSILKTIQILRNLRNYSGRIG